MKLTQKQIVEKRVLKYGYVENVWAFQHQILRLSERIRELKKDGYAFETIYRNKKGERNTKYLLIK